jgi:polysaccharide export outer membrane protein
MFDKRKFLFSSIIICVFISFLSACYGGFMASSVPVKQYLENRDAYDIKTEKVRAETLEEIKKMTLVKGNSTFTEKRGYPEYIVGPGDVLIINFWEGPNPKPYEATVRPDGRISYSFVDDVLVAGQTTAEIASTLIKALKEYIRVPRLEIMVKEYRSKTVLLSGQINVLQQGISGPGKYNLKGKTTALDLIVLAGGPIVGRGAPATGATSVAGAGSIPTGDADMKKVELVRAGKKYTLNLYDAMFKGDTSQNVVLDDNDILTVPELPIFGERIYVFGEVNQEGIYRLKDAADLLSALSISMGLTRIAVKEDIKIIRGYKERNRKPLILSANYYDIVKRADLSQNIQLLNGDVVYVPRTTIGDVNEFILNTTPLLDYLFYPSKYRDSYMNTNWMRMNNF